MNHMDTVVTVAFRAEIEHVYEMMRGGQSFDDAIANVRGWLPYFSVSDVISFFNQAN